MSSAAPTLAGRIERLCMLAAGISALLSFLLASFADIMSVRHFSTDDFNNLVKAVATSDNFIAARDNPKRMNRFLREFSAIPGIRLACLYNTRNILIGAWQDPEFPSHCADIPIERDIGTGWFDLILNIPINHEGVYQGTILVSGRAITATEFRIHEIIILTALLFCLLLTVAVTRRMTLQDMRLQINAVHDQLRCFMDPSRTDCTILPKNFTVEMAQVMANIAQLHEHFISTMVSKQTLERSQEWHRQVFSHFITSLRRQISADSELLRDLNDYALIMQTENEHALPPERIFDCGIILDRALTDARRIQPPHRRVHLSVSLQTGMPRLYHGHPELFEALLRHLLLIAFWRTKAGLVLLRLSPETTPGDSSNVRLRIRLEDSGPPLQPWQLRRWLRHTWEEEPSTPDEHAISWVLATRLFHHLKGSANAESPAEGGLKLDGFIPLSIAWRPSDFLLLSSTSETAHLAPPMILIVEPEAGSRRELAESFTTAGYRIFVVQEHAQALEWALCLPLSVVLLNMAAPGAWQDTARRLRKQMHQHILPETALWTLTTQRMPDTGDAIEQVLLKPLRMETLRDLRSRVRPLDNGFYHAFDQALRDDLPVSVIARMPYLHQQLELELRRMKDMALVLSQDLACPDAASQAHAIKSIALSLGYYRLAALMTEIEHAVTTQIFAHMPQNWSVVAECLGQASVLKAPPPQNPHARFAVSS